MVGLAICHTSKRQLNSVHGRGHLNSVIGRIEDGDDDVDGDSDIDPEDGQPEEDELSLEECGDEQEQGSSSNMARVLETKKWHGFLFTDIERSRKKKGKPIVFRQWQCTCYRHHSSDTNTTYCRKTRAYQVDSDSSRDNVLTELKRWALAGDT